MNIRFLLPFILIPTLLLAEAPLWCRYPAISPNGSNVTFSCMGDLWQVPSMGGKAQALTRGASLETRPIYSPDGQWLAYASDQQGNLDVYIMPAEGGRSTRLTFHSASDRPYAFTPDSQRILFSSSRQDAQESRLFPARFLNEIYSVGIQGDRPIMEWTTAAEELAVNAKGQVLYESVPALEDEFRKHHQSSATRDIWLRNSDGTHVPLTDFAGEDRDPVWMPDGSFCFLSERAGSQNIFRMEPGGQAEQLSFHAPHAIRGLSVSAMGLLAYSYHGQLFTILPGEAPKKLSIEMTPNRRAEHERVLELSKGATDVSLSPDGREVALVVRGEIFVTSVKHGSTRRISDTPLQERNPVFAPDGRSLCYAGERDGKWQLFETRLVREEEKHFYCASELTTRVLLDSPDDCFQPLYSPDGKSLAYFARRCELRVLDLASGDERVILPENEGYSYSDGDQHVAWSPDSKWLTFHAPTPGRWMDDIFLISLETGEKINASLSGYADFAPRFSADGRAVLFMSNRNGLRSHASWGGQDDVYALALNRESNEWFHLNEERFEEIYGDDEEFHEDDEEKDGKSKSKKSIFSFGSKKDQADKDTVQVTVEAASIDRRLHRLTLTSASIHDFAWTPDGKTLLTLSRFEDGTDLWETDWRAGETKRLARLDLSGGQLQIDKEGRFVLILGDGGQMQTVNLSNGETEGVSYHAEMRLQQAAEWEGLFDHIWRQVREKFYDENLHGCDWDSLGADYARVLPWIDHKQDFADCMSEMLGELNASHTGCFARHNGEGLDATASLGLVLDPFWNQDGLKVLEVLEAGPFDRAASKMTADALITAIDGQEILAATNPWPLLNRRAGDPLLIEFKDAEGNSHGESIRPLSSWGAWRLFYQRWMDRNAQEVTSLSDGRLGYVHITSMNDASFRRLYHEALGRYSECEGLVVDSRHNGGGWLTDDLVTFLSGRRTFRTIVRPGPRQIGEEPYKSWNRPSIVLMNESNYSDAHLFPFSYKDNGVGKLVGMPVAGTGTAVWWENLIDRDLVFGIPEVGILDESGKYLENQQLEPDIRVVNDPQSVSQGRDLQLEAAVKELLRELDEKALSK